MRGTRWLLLVAIVAIVAGLGLTYRAQKKILAAKSPAKPEKLASDLNSSAEGWAYSTTDGQRTKVSITAKDFFEAKDSSRIDLKQVTLKLFNKSGDAYDLVTSEAATFFKNAHRFYSEGEVVITLAVPKDKPPTHTPVSIKSSGVNFDTDTGQAETDRASSFAFEHGTGSSTGAFYDPASRVLTLKNNVKLDWKPVGPRAKPMKIEAGTLYYREAESEIWLKPWGRMTRDTTVIEGNDATIKLQEVAGEKDGATKKVLRSIEATKAHGSDSEPKRKLQYSAEHLLVNFNDDGDAEKVLGDAGSQLVSTSDSAETSIAARHVDLSFDTSSGDSVLTGVTGEGNAVVTSKPLPVAGRPIGETHVLRSEKLDMKMRPGGREIETVAAREPGTLEFLPNLPIQRHRTLTGRDMLIAYGPQNRVESFKAADVHTQTEPTPEEKKRNRVTSVTSSKLMEARFDPKTNRIATIDQTGDFTYEEGDRKARANKGSMDSGHNLIVLDTNARMSDATGMTSADLIRMDQLTGNFSAEGNVNSSRMPEKDKKKNSEMLAGDEPLHAQARRMDSANRNKKLHYEGNVVMWQGANRIQADTVDLDREKHTLIADGNVLTNLWEEPKDPQKKKTTVPVLTEVRSKRLVYTEADRQAVYTGGATLKQPNMQVTSTQLRAFLSEAGADSRLEKAIADGDVHIHKSGKLVSYDGRSEHSEYYTKDQKLIMTGGSPTMTNSQGWSTVGPGGLTYYANDDRLIVNGSEKQPANSIIQRKK
jgi:lipopolysaccharide export system protein LptA